jgi:hypothetical protein
MKYLFYVGPPFAPFAGDIMREIAQNDPSAEFHAICAYNKREVRALEDRLGRTLDGWHLAMPQQKIWIKQPVSSGECSEFLEKYGQEVFARTLIADRFLSQGYVSGGVVKPNPEIDEALKDNPFGATRYVIRLYQFVGEIMDAVKPDFIFSYVVANSIAFSIAKSAQARGTLFAQIKPARLGQRYVLDTAVEDKFELVRARIERDRGLDVNDVAFDQAREWLTSFRQKTTQPEYHVTNTQRALARKSWKVFAEAGFQVLRHGFRYALDRHGGRRKKIARALQRALVEYQAVYDMRVYLGGKIPEEPFVYYPLHVDPEASTMVLTPYHTDQLSVIEALSKALPPGELLVVKEHLPMVGRRPKGFYSRIASIHNVVLLGPLHNGIEVLKQSSAVAVITGTAGWEALCLGVPVLVIGSAPYTLIGSGLQVEGNLSALSSALALVRGQPPASDDMLVRYIQALFDCSFDMPAKTVFGGYNEVSKEVISQAAISVATHIQILLQAKR